MKKTLLLLFVLSLLLPCSLHAQFREVDVRFNGISPISDTAVSQGLVSFLGLSADFSFKLNDTLPGESGSQYNNNALVSYRQCYKGVYIEHTTLKLSFTRNKLTGLFGTVLHQAPCVQDEPAISERQAFELAKLYDNAGNYVWEDSELFAKFPRNRHNILLFPQPYGELLYYTENTDSGCPKLVFKFHMISAKGSVDNFTYVSATTGEKVGMVNHAVHTILKDTPSDDVSITTYPNPAGDFLNVLFLTGIEVEATVSIVDVDFKLVKEVQLNTKLSRIDLRDVANGAYYAHVNHGGKTTSVKFVKH